MSCANCRSRASTSASTTWPSSGDADDLRAARRRAARRAAADLRGHALRVRRPDAAGGRDAAALPPAHGRAARLRADFTFLRRSFYRDVAGRDPEQEVARSGRRSRSRSRGRPSAEAADRSSCSPGWRSGRRRPPLPELAGARVLVTGAAGFIGANLCRRSSRPGPRCTSLVRPGRTCPGRRGSRGGPAGCGSGGRAVAAARPEVVLHLAAGAGHARDAAGRAAMVADTVLGTANLLEAVRRAEPRRLVHVGGGLEYGHADRPLRETDPLRPVTFRGAVKGAATLLALELGSWTEIEVAVLRPFAVYGPWKRLPASSHCRDHRAPRRADRGDGGHGRTGLRLRRRRRRGLPRRGDSPAAAGEIVNVGSGRLTTNRVLVERPPRSRASSSTSASATTSRVPGTTAPGSRM